MAIYKNTPPIVTNGLVLHLDAGSRMSYPGSGTAWTDLSGNSRNGTLSATGSGAVSASYDSSNQGAIVFSGTGSYINTSYTNPAPPFTFSNTIYPSVNDSTRVTFFGNANNYFISILNGFFTFGRTGVAHDVTSTTAATINKWYNIIATVDASGNVSLYINGILDKTGTTVILTPNTVINISNNVYPFKGNISNASIYNRALSAQEVNQNYNALKSRFGLT